jgi:hypothetical protein
MSASRGRPKGYPKSGGRTAGTPNKLTQGKDALKQQVAERLAEALGPELFDGDAHLLMQAIYRNTALPLELRLDAAKAAAPYEKPRLAQSNVTLRTVTSVDELSDAELAALARSAAVGAAAGGPNESGSVH